jgi:hypothetical protein
VCLFSGWDGLPSDMLMPDHCIAVTGRLVIPPSEGLEFRDQFGNLVFSSEATTCYVSGIGTCQDLIVGIPETHNGLPVTAIGRTAFVNCEFIREVYIPDSVKIINSAAFESCDSLKKVRIPRGAAIYGAAFWNCEELTDLDIPYKDVIYPNSVKAFAGCSLTEFVFPDNILEIEDSFLRNNRITEIIIPENVSSIDYEAFRYCIYLKKIFLPVSLRSVTGQAFSDCDSLTDIYYQGTQEQWNNINITYAGSSFRNAIVHYNSTIEDYNEG